MSIRRERERLKFKGQAVVLMKSGDSQRSERSNGVGEPSVLGRGCHALYQNLHKKLRYVDGQPELAGFGRSSFEIAQPSGTAFLDRNLYSKTIGEAVGTAGSTSIVAVDMAPSLDPSYPNGVKARCLAIEADWTSFNEFQVGLIKGDAFLVDVAFLDAQESWVLLKTLERIYFFKLV